MHCIDKISTLKTASRLWLVDVKQNQKLNVSKTFNAFKAEASAMIAFLTGARRPALALA